MPDFEFNMTTYLLFLFVFLLFVGLIMMLIPKPIMVIQDKNGKIIFRIYQNGISMFLLKGSHGYPRKIQFKRFTEVKAFIELNMNGY